MGCGRVRAGAGTGAAGATSGADAAGTAGAASSGCPNGATTGVTGTSVSEVPEPSRTAATAPPAAATDTTAAVTNTEVFIRPRHPTPPPCTSSACYFVVARSGDPNVDEPAGCGYGGQPTDGVPGSARRAYALWRRRWEVDPPSGADEQTRLINLCGCAC